MFRVDFQQAVDFYDDSCVRLRFLDPGTGRPVNHLPPMNATDYATSNRFSVANLRATGTVEIESNTDVRRACWHEGSAFLVLRFDGDPRREHYFDGHLAHRHTQDNEDAPDLLEDRFYPPSQSRLLVTEKKITLRQKEHRLTQEGDLQPAAAEGPPSMWVTNLWFDQGERYVGIECHHDGLALIRTNKHAYIANFTPQQPAHFDEVHLADPLRDEAALDLTTPAAYINHSVATMRLSRVNSANNLTQYFTHDVPGARMIGAYALHTALLHDTHGGLLVVDFEPRALTEEEKEDGRLLNEMFAYDIIVPELLEKGSECRLSETKKFLLVWTRRYLVVLNMLNGMRMFVKSVKALRDVKFIHREQALLCLSSVRESVLLIYLNLDWPLGGLPPPSPRQASSSSSSSSSTL